MRKGLSISEDKQTIRLKSFFRQATNFIFAETNPTMRALFLFLLIAFGTTIKAQDLHNGDYLVTLMHKHIDSAEVRTLKKEYSMQKSVVPNSWYGNGLSFYAPEGYIHRMTFLRNDKEYGNYTGTLPAGLTFEMKGEDLKAKFPDGEAKDDYFKFSTGGHAYEVKFTSSAMKKIEFIAVTY